MSHGYALSEEAARSRAPNPADFDAERNELHSSRRVDASLIDRISPRFPLYLLSCCRKTPVRLVRAESATSRVRHNVPGNSTVQHVEFVPFSIEVSGVWGPAARGFFRESIAMAHSARDIDLYHWSNQRLSDSWKSTFSVLVARERARVGMAAATQDWARRINRMRDSDQENQDAGH